MKRTLLALALVLSAAVSCAAEKINLFNAVKAEPGGAVGDVYYTNNVNGTITRLAHPGVANYCLLTAVTPNRIFWSSSCGGGGGGFTSPLTTKGDVHVYSTTDARFPVGANGLTIFADSTQTFGMLWRAIAESDVTSLASDLSARPTGSGSTNAVTYWSSSSALTSNSGMNFNPSVHRLELGVPSTATGTLRFYGSTSGWVGFTSPAAPVSNEFVLPAADGTSGQCLQTNGSLVLSFATCAGTTYTASTGVKLTGTLFTLDIPGLTQDTAPDPAADYIPEIDFSASTHKKVLIGDLPFWQISPAAAQTGNIYVKGEVRLYGATSGYTGWKSPATASSVVFTTPSNVCSSGQVWTDNGSGVYSCATVSTGSGGTGIVSLSTALGSEGSGSTGDLNFPTNGNSVHRYASGTWANPWGPIYKLTPPPTLTSSQTTTLSANINNAVTALTFVSGSGWPTVPFLMQIGTEDFKVTALNTGTGVSTVVRGYNGTTAASHTAGDTITQLNWEWVNKGASSTVTAITNEGFYLDGGTDSAAHNLRMYKRLIVNTTSGDVQVAVSPAVAITGAATPLALGEVGLFMRESATGKITRLGCYSSGSGAAPAILISHYSSPTASPSNVFYGYTYNPSMTWLRMTVVGANILYRMSFNGGINWITLLSVAKTTPFTTAPDEWGVEANPLSTTQTSGVGVYGFVEN